MLTASKIRSDTAALHTDFDLGNLFKDEQGAMPIKGFLVEDTESEMPLPRSARTINGHIRLRTVEQLEIGSRVYRIESGRVTAEWEITDDREVEGEHGYLLNNYDT